MSYQHDIQGCLSKIKNLDAYEPHAKKALLEIKQAKHALLEIVFEEKDIIQGASYAQRFRTDFKDIVILGTGGSSLGGQMLAALKSYGLTFPSSPPHLHFLDNIDPFTFDHFFTVINPQTTGFIVISKSGSTTETLCQFLIVWERWKQHLNPAKLKDHFLIITEPKDSILRDLAAALNLPVLTHPSTIGGRFSVLSIVGLLPAMLLGLDPHHIRQGAQETITQSFDLPEASQPMIGAAVSFALWQEHQIKNSVLMPYSDRLRLFSFWYRQLWAESLGKKGKGLTPLNALGTVDQHSQLQLYLDGPKDKMFTILTTAHSGQGDTMRSPLTKDENLSYLLGRKMGDLMQAEQTATITTLINRGCPTRVIHVPCLNEQAIGALSMHFMLETMIAAKLLKVNAFDQPAVEEGKSLAREYLKKMDAA